MRDRGAGITSKGVGWAGLLGPTRAALLGVALLILALAASLLAGHADARVLAPSASGGASAMLPAAETAVPPKITKQPTNKTFNEGEEVGKKTIQHTITPNDGKPMAIAVIFERWEHDDGSELLTFVMVK